MASKAKLGFERDMVRPRLAPPRAISAAELAIRTRLPQRQHRLMIFDRPAGPWRNERSQAHLDAILAGMASMEEWSGTVFITVPAWIQERPAP